MSEAAEISLGQDVEESLPGAGVQLGLEWMRRNPSLVEKKEGNDLMGV